MSDTCEQQLASAERMLGCRSDDRGNSIELALQDGKTWSAPVRGAGVEVKCLAGLVWITLEGDPEDHVLSPGASYSTSRRGRLAIMAFQSSRVRVGSDGD